MKVFLIFFLFIAFFSCVGYEVSDPKLESELRVEDFLFVEKLSYGVKDSVESSFDEKLIPQLAKMKTDTLDCSADIYMKIIASGKKAIPFLIESLTDSTPTNIFDCCKNENLNIGDVSYFALSEICATPAYLVTKIEFDVVENKNGCNCWNFYDYLFDINNKNEFQIKVKEYFNNTDFEYVGFPDSIIPDCYVKYGIKGAYRSKD